MLTISTGSLSPAATGSIQVGDPGSDRLRGCERSLSLACPVIRGLRVCRGEQNRRRRPCIRPLAVPAVRVTYVMDAAAWGGAETYVARLVQELAGQITPVVITSEAVSPR